MKIKIELDMTTQEMEELLVPGERRTEFKAKMYDALMKMSERVVRSQMGEDHARK